MKTLECWFCGNGFVAVASRSHFCSDKCRLYIRRARGLRYEFWHKQEMNAYRSKYRKTDKAKATAAAYHRKADKLKSRARWTVRHAIVAGRLIAKPCIKCGKKAHAHHPDYSKPLEVIWLCPLHHKEEHRRINEHQN